MRFGLFFQAPEATGQTHAERYAEMFDLYPSPTSTTCHA